MEELGTGHNLENMEMEKERVVIRIEFKFGWQGAEPAMKRVLFVPHTFYLPRAGGCRTSVV